MTPANSSTYRSVVLRLLKYSNTVAIAMVLIAFYVCFASSIWLYAAVLGISSGYLLWLTCQYIISESTNCGSSCNFQYGCQVASFNSRLSIVSNATISLIGVADTGIIIKYMLSSEVANYDYKILGIPYLLGVLKMLLIYMVSDKIHTSHLLMSVLYRYSQSIRFLNIDIDKKNPDNLFPLIFLDGYNISTNRYRVAAHEDKITIIFDPALSIGDNSRVEYKLVKENDCDRVVSEEPIYDKYIQPTCFFRCHVVVRNVTNTANTEQDVEFDQNNQAKDK
jgi:hypothetical protein